MARPQATLAREPLLEVELGDSELVVREHPDGLFTIDVNDERLVVNAEQLQPIVVGFARIGQLKGWT